MRTGSQNNCTNFAKVSTFLWQTFSDTTEQPGAANIHASPLFP